MTVSFQKGCTHKRNSLLLDICGLRGLQNMNRHMHMHADWSGISNLLILKEKDTLCKNMAKLFGKYSKVFNTKNRVAPDQAAPTGAV